MATSYMNRGCRRADIPRAIEDCDALLARMLRQPARMPRARRFTLGRHIKDGLLFVLERPVETANSKSKSEPVRRAPFYEPCFRAPCDAGASVLKLTALTEWVLIGERREPGLFAAGMKFRTNHSQETGRCARWKPTRTAGLVSAAGGCCCLRCGCWRNWRRPLAPRSCNCAWLDGAELCSNTGDASFLVKRGSRATIY